jgi:hypothetical protein
VPRPQLRLRRVNVGLQARSRRCSLCALVPEGALRGGEVAPHGSFAANGDLECCGRITTRSCKERRDERRVLGGRAGREAVVRQQQLRPGRR